MWLKPGARQLCVCVWSHLTVLRNVRAVYQIQPIIYFILFFGMFKREQCWTAYIEVGGAPESVLLSTEKNVWERSSM